MSEKMLNALADFTRAVAESHHAAEGCREALATVARIAAEAPIDQGEYRRYAVGQWHDALRYSLDTLTSAYKSICDQLEDGTSIDSD